MTALTCAYAMLFSRMNEKIRSEQLKSYTLAGVGCEALHTRQESELPALNSPAAIAAKDAFGEQPGAEALLPHRAEFPVAGYGKLSSKSVPNNSGGVRAAAKSRSLGPGGSRCGG